MPRVLTKTKIRLGADRRCGRCGDAIEPGQQYRQWSFRYGGTHYRCMKSECRPRQSELTQSKMSEVYGAVEAAEDNLPGLGTQEAIEEEVQGVADPVRDVADEYREAAEAMGEAGAEMEERADELEGWADELEQWEFQGMAPDPDDEEVTDEVQAEFLEEVRSEATDALGECPL